MTVKCGKCGHFHEVVEDTPLACTLTGCGCIDFTPYMPDFIQIQQVIQNFKTWIDRVKYLLLTIPETRDEDELAFLFTCWHYFLGMTTGVMFTGEMYYRLKTEARPETIRRAKQKVCHEERIAYLAGELDLRDAVFIPSKPELIHRKEVKKEAMLEAVTTL